MFGLGKWKRLEGDGKERALEYEGGIFWVPLDEVHSLTDAMRWVRKVGETSWATKSDVVDLAELLFDHIESIRRRDEEKKAQREEAAMAAMARALGAATQLAVRLGAQEASLKDLELGTTWGAWNYRNEEARGAYISYGAGNPIGLNQISTPEDVSSMAQHLCFKRWPNERDLADAVEALVTCCVKTSLRSSSKRER